MLFETTHILTERQGDTREVLTLGEYYSQYEETGVE